MVHLSKLLRHGEPTPYYPNPRLMIGTGKEVLNFGSHYFPLLPVYLVTMGGCLICALYIGRSLFISSDVKYKELQDLPDRDQGIDLYRDRSKVIMTTKDYYRISKGKKEEEE